MLLGCVSDSSGDFTGETYLHRLLSTRRPSVLADPRSLRK